MNRSQNVRSNRREEEAISLKASLREIGITHKLTPGDLLQVSDVQFLVTKNAMNLITFISSISVAICVGLFGWTRDGKGSFKNVHDDVPTLVTPVFWTNSLWIVIYLLEMIFVICQMRPSFRNLVVLHRGVGWYFFLAHCSQIAWVVSYSFDEIVLAGLFMLLTAIFLCLLCIKIYFFDFVSTDDNLSGSDPTDTPPAILSPVMEFIIFRLPFQLHFGWLIFMLGVNINEIGKRMDVSWQPALAILSLIALWILGMIALFYPKHPNFPIALAISWGAMGIWCELSPPPEAFSNIYSESTVERTRIGAIAMCIELFSVSILRHICHISSFYYVEPLKDEGETVGRSRIMQV